MIKNRTAQLIFQTVYVVLGVIGAINSIGYFDAEFNTDFYVYYTNLSNYICLGMMFVFLSNTAKRREDGLCMSAPTFNFMCVIMILVTFLVYNVLLSDEYTVIEYFTTMSNMIMHVILPIMFILNWVLFCPHGKMKLYQPLLCLFMPLVYVAFVFVRAAFIDHASASVVYPYFFLDAGELGAIGVLTWIAVLLVIFVAIGYLFFVFDRYAVNTKKGSTK